MTEQAPATDGPRITPLLRTYDEAFGLLVEARNYVVQGQPLEERGLPPQERLRIGLETMRLTTRLTQAMAWLLAQRAVMTGELSAEQAASEDYALGAQALCLADDAAPPPLPPRLQDLMDRSASLYRRVDRLDRQARARVSGDRPVWPGEFSS